MSWSSRITLPSTRAPSVSSCMRLSERRNVDLPHPDDPMMAVTLLGWIVIVTLFTAWKEP